MHPASLLDLPSELLYKIIDLLEQRDLQMLSSASIRELRPFIGQLLYDTIEIRLFKDSIQFMHNKNGFTPKKYQLRYVQSITLTTAQPYYPNGKTGPTKQWGLGLTTLFGRASSEPLKDLKHVVSSLDNVTSVRWAIPAQREVYRAEQSIPSGIRLDFNSILLIVASLPSLHTFTLDVSNSSIHLRKNVTRFGLEHLHSLKSLSFTGFPGKNLWASSIEPFILVIRNSPALEDLSLDFVGCYHNEHSGSFSLEKLLQGFPTTQPLKLRKLSLRTPVWNLQISEASGIHLKNLTTLELRFPSSPSFQSPPSTTLGEGLWSVLGHHGTRLKHLYAPVTPELVDYLQTYSGVEYLRLYGAADDVLAHRFHGHALRLHVASLNVLNTSLVTSPNGGWAFAARNAQVFAKCLGLRELWVSIHGKRPIDTLTLLLRISNSLPHLRWLSIGQAISSSMYGSKEVHTPFFKWMSSTAVMFYELDITDLLDSEGSIHAFTVVLGFLKLTTSSCGVEPDLHRHPQVIQAIKPRLTGPGHSFRWVLKHDYGNSELIQSSWPYVDPEPIRGRLL